MADYQAALKMTLSAIELCRQLDDKHFMRLNYLQLSNVYSALKDYEKAFNAQKVYINLDTEIYTGESLTALTQLLADIDTEKRTEQLFDLKDAQEEREKELASHIRAKLRYLYMMLAIMLVAVVIFLLYRQKNSEVRKRVIAQAELKTLNHNLEDRIAAEIEKFKVQQRVVTQKSKLEGLRTLAAGIAHEINQPLSAMAMSLENIQDRIENDTATLDYCSRKCESIYQDIDRIRKIIEHVRLFSRDQSNTDVSKIDINSIIQNALVLHDPWVKKKNILIKLYLHSLPLHTIGNPYKLEQVMLNLLSNASDAMEARSINESDSGYVKEIVICSCPDMRNALITFHDNGIGMPEEQLQKVFDPFFTTKEPDKGTGLGLSICLGIIEEMDGWMRVESKENEYTMIKISLPLLEGGEHD